MAEGHLQVEKVLETPGQVKDRYRGQQINR